MTKTSAILRSFSGVAAPVLLALLLATGCSDSGRQQTGDGSGAGNTPAAAGKGIGPYYHGLIEEYRSVLTEDPHNLAATIALANALYDAGQWHEAIQYYERALAINPHNADVITDMGTCYRNLGMIDQALKIYEHALTVEPTHEDTLFNLGVVYGNDKKDYARAIKYWDRLLHVAPNHPQAAYVHSAMLKFKNALRSRPR